jgi:alpha-maltose-1-phosphate synthase
VLPTVFEGFGLVIVEAMAAGLPVITTAHSMGPDVVTNGKNGWIVPIRDSSSLKDRILQLRQLSDSDYLNMRQSARQAALGFTWDGFRERLGEMVVEF